MDKLKMAHDYLLKTMKETAFVDESDICFFVDTAWKYADAMQAEADKRNKAEAAQKRKEIREMLDAPNTFVEREGQHFDDVEEWQPDWSQAPAWANWWAMDADGRSAWYSYEPYYGDNREYWSDYKNKYDWNDKSLVCPSFDYQGDWKDSLRERPL